MPKGISLHIGLNSVDASHYADWAGPLNACETDANDMGDLASSRGFETTMKLTARQATRDAVKRAIRNAAHELESGDMFLLTYSGHGGQVPDRTGDEDDRWDETWCLFDAQLLDDELYELWGEFAAGVRILVISDSCHSGSAVRAPSLVDPDCLNKGSTAENLGVAGARYRFMPRSTAEDVYRLNREFYESLQAGKTPPTDPAASVRLISACQDNQLALDGRRNGFFTSTLLTVWDDGRFKGDYRQFHARIQARMPSTQSPNHMVVGGHSPAYDAQVPFTI